MLSGWSRWVRTFPRSVTAGASVKNEAIDPMTIRRQPRFPRKRTPPAPIGQLLDLVQKKDRSVGEFESDFA
jgi:hypothetical protein